MYILGINISHNPSICIFKNNKILKFINEDRLKMFKNFSPTTCENLNFNFFYSILKHVDDIPDLVLYSSYGRTDEKNYEVIKIIQNQLNNPRYLFNQYEHHLYHALCGHYFSKFEESLCIVVDGGGALLKKNNSYQEYQSIFYVNKNKFYKLFQHFSNIRYIDLNRIDDSKKYFYHYEEDYSKILSNDVLGGYLHGTISRACGYDGGHDSGKLMGLAAYANTDKKFNLNYEHVELAEKVQKKSFSQTCELIERAYDFKNIKNFVLSGGYFLNCSNNFKYIKKYPKFNFFVDPVPQDNGTAIGVCLEHVYYK